MNEKNLFFLLVIICLLFLSFSAKAQKLKIFKSYARLSRPEKCWVIKHPFIAKRVLKLSLYARQQTDSLKHIKYLDADDNGGQLDAFRHSYWMALLAQKISCRKALALGKAHEKGNYLDFKHKRLEDGTLPDKISSEMDLCNNKEGVCIGRFYGIADKFKLRDIVIDSLKAGKMKIIKKNISGGFLDKDNNIIPLDSLTMRWINAKCLVNSDYLRH
ncbi:MAG: hypothetical protein KA792_09880 [Bacteroidales bacterium]|nr:hypothetical protein [Bacteroidales bacterium]